MVALIGSRPGCLPEMPRSCNCIVLLIQVAQVAPVEQELPGEDQQDPVDGLEQKDMADGKDPREDRCLVHILELGMVAAIPGDKPRHIVA